MIHDSCFMIKNPSKKESLDHIRHSLAHLLAMAVLKKFPAAKLGIGPAIEHGFYYDFKLPRPISEADLAQFEQTMRELIAAKLDFKGKKVTPAKAKKLFKNQPFKLDLIKEFVKEKKQLTVYYTCPPAISSKLKAKNCFADLCHGGHVKNTSEINPTAFKLARIAGAYWRGSESNPQLTRIYGLAFGDKRELDAHLKLQEEIARCDHRIIGEKLDLFSQHAVAPGTIFWHPKGMMLWRILEEFIREKNAAYGYGEVQTPVMVKKELFETSGHWEHYRENGFWFAIDGETYVLKPMNCPEAALIYAARLRSYRDLPIRLAEPTGRLHRNELAGVLGGLFRTRQFTQDDAHIFCRPDQIGTEIKTLIRYAKEVYAAVELPVSFRLATRPDNALGAPKLWKQAEEALKRVLEASAIGYETKPKDGAFYGPKIDIHAKDAIGREHQLATIQLDFQMPLRFKLAYIDEQGTKQTPVMIHRAVLGSFERFIGVLIEHYAGAFPLWLAPLQLAVLAVNDAASPYCRSVEAELKRRGWRVTMDERKETIGRKIREAELAKIPYLLVIGEREAAAKTVSVRERGKGDRGAVKLEVFLKTIAEERMPPR